MPPLKGKNLPLSLPRRFICDLIYFARKVPTVTVQRRMNIAAVKDMRDRITSRPSWCAIFTKAYSQVTMAFPQLRRAYICWPWPHLYEHPHSTASVAIERQYKNEEAVFFVHLRTPDQQTLSALDEHLRRFKLIPIEDISLFRRALYVSKIPWPLRRWVWWIGLNSSGHKRAKRMGTFGVSVYSGLGATSLNPLSPLTTTLNYGIIEADGSVDVRIIYDHRVMDGATVARALARMETILNQDMVAELDELARSAPSVATQECRRSA